MEMKRINAGKLRAIGYDVRERTLRVEFDDGTALDYAGVGQETWRRLSTASSSTAWSFYRDNIEEEFHGKRSRVNNQSLSNRAALDSLFKASDGEPED